MPPLPPPSTGYDPDEPCRPLSQIPWASEFPLIDPRWRTEPVLGLAAAIRETSDFSRLVILADALEDAGCDNAYVLHHCRQPAEHHAHCWVVSAVLNTSWRVESERPIPQENSIDDEILGSLYSPTWHESKPLPAWMRSGLILSCGMAVLVFFLALVLGF